MKPTLACPFCGAVPCQCLTELSRDARRLMRAGDKKGLADFINSDSQIRAWRAVARVHQQDQQGCGIACLAMVLGCNYVEARKKCGNVLTRGGMTTYSVQEVLAVNGFSYQVQWKVDPTTNEQRPEWPLKPWASIHMLQVQIPGGSHWVVMDAVGAILDPYDAERTTLAGIERVNEMIGIWPAPNNR